MIDDRNIGRALAAVKREVARWREPVVGLYRHDPYETLISCLLSLRTKDETTAAASARLFALARSPRAMLRVPRRTLARVIYPVGFYRTKARTILELSRTLVERHGGAVPDTLDLLTISVEAGLAFDSALSQVARNTTGPLAEEFFRVLQEMQIGLGRADAMRALGDRTDLPELRGFITSMVQADSFGIPIAHVLRVQAREMRVKRSQRAEELAQKVPVKILFPLSFCILPALFVVILGPAVIQIFTSFNGRL